MHIGIVVIKIQINYFTLQKWQMAAGRIFTHLLQKGAKNLKSFTFVKMKKKSSLFGPQTRQVSCYFVVL